MTKEKTKKIISIMQAFVDGKTIEYSAKWEDSYIVHSSEPCREFDRFKYRIKPKSKLVPKQILLKEI